MHYNSILVCFIEVTLKGGKNKNEIVEYSEEKMILLQLCSMSMSISIITVYAGLSCTICILLFVLYCTVLDVISPSPPPSLPPSLSLSLSLPIRSTGGGPRISLLGQLDDFI
jgi:hypothetical protein